MWGAWPLVLHCTYDVVHLGHVDVVLEGIHQVLQVMDRVTETVLEGGRGGEGRGSGSSQAGERQEIPERKGSTCAGFAVGAQRVAGTFSQEQCLGRVVHWCCYGWWCWYGASGGWCWYRAWLQRSGLCKQKPSVVVVVLLRMSPHPPLPPLSPPYPAPCPRPNPKP